jgi:hypothetical protein
MQILRVRPAILVAIIIFTALYGVSGITVAHAAGPTVSFAISPLFILAGGNDSFTATASGGTPPYTYSWNFGDGTPIASGISTTHIYPAGTYTIALTVTDASSAMSQASQSVTVHGSPLNIDSWQVNWNITDHHGVEIYNSTYNGVLTIRDALINGVSVVYFQQPPSLSCLFFDDLGHDDLAASPAGFTVQSSTDPLNPWFQIRANFNPSRVGYNYTEFWRFYQDGEWDASLYVGHIGCGWNHTYQPHYRIDLAIGNKNRDLMSQYTPSGVWQNLIWEGNYTDNGMRDMTHNATEWRLGDGTGYYYIKPQVTPYATDMPKIPTKIYLVRDRSGELEPDINPPPAPMDPINFANGELAYRQSIAFWYLPTFGDHWLYSVGQTPTGYPSVVSLSFYPSGI